MIRSALFFSLFVLSHFAMAQDVVEEVEKYSRELAKYERSRVETEDSQRELRMRLQRLPEDSADASQVKAELEQGKLVIEEIEAIQKALRERLDVLQSEPEYQIWKQIKDDRRRPTKKNISGLWSAYFGLTGYQMQLEQRGEAVTGRGYHWGCIGMFGAFEVKGTFRNGVLSLTYFKSARKPEENLFMYYEERRRPRFRSTNGKRSYPLTPQVDIRLN